MQKYKLSYDWQDIAEVEIDETKALPIMEEMILFWAGGKNWIKDNNGDITKTWLKMLTRFLIMRRRQPDDDEGWYNLDGTHGIKLSNFCEWELDEDQIEVESI